MKEVKKLITPQQLTRVIKTINKSLKGNKSVVLTIKKKKIKIPNTARVFLEYEKKKNKNEFEIEFKW